MKKITLLLMMIISSLAFTQVQVGTGTLEAENAPLEPFFGFTYNQSVYLASEINASGSITGLQWFYSGTTALPNTQNIVIYMAESTRTEFTSTTDWEPIASFTQVYSGGITISTPGVDGWVSITFDTPFAYSGTDNLLVAVEDNMAGFDSSSDDFHNSDVTGNRTISHFSDSVNADPAAPPTASNIDNTIPNVIFDGIAQTCTLPSITSNSYTNVSADFSWTAGVSMESDWEYALLLDTDPEPASGTSTMSTSYMESGLTPSTGYTFWLRAFCGGSDYSGWTSVSFTTVAGTPPANDNCGNAVGLTVNADQNCSVVTNGTVLNATDSGVTGSTCSGTDDDDVWYSFMATGSAHRISLINISGSTSDMYHAIYDSTPSCGSLGAAIICNDGNTSNLTGLSIGTVYYVQVYTWTATTGQDSVFDICVGTPPPAPGNDECLGALTLTESADDNCANAVSGTTVSATASTEDDCSATNKDVWYTLSTSQSGLYRLLVTETQDFGFSSTYVSVFEGSCGALTQVGSSCFSTEINVNLTASTTYYVNVRSTSSTEGVNFDLCAYPLPPAPGNDDCAAADVLTESTDTSCNNTVSGTTVSATASSEDDCSTTNPDVWYTFVPTQTNDYQISVTETQDFGSSSTYVSVFEGSCGSLTQVGSSCFSSSGTYSLTMGTTYYINVRSTSTLDGVNFDLCAFPLPPAPSNDDCGTADTLTESTDSSCNNTVSGTTVSATASSEDDCSTSNPDVWYTFSPTTTGDYYLTAIETQDFGSSSTYISLFEGSCGALTQVGTDCNENTLLASLTSGTTYYVNVRSTSTSSGVNFDLCAFLAPAAPANDDCPGEALTVGAVFSSNPVDGTVISATQAAEVGDCGLDGPGVWYSVVVPGDGNITIETGPDSGTGTTTFDSVIEAFSGTCGALTSIECDDDDATTANFSLLDLTGLAPGSTIYIRVWEYAGDEIEPFAISAYSATLGGSQFESPNAFKYFPNPANNTLSLRAQNTIQNVTVFNMLGQEVLKTSPNAISKDLNIAALQSGSYFVKVTINNTTQTIRIIKK